MMEWLSLGWRDVILLLVTFAGIYLVMMLLRLTQIGRRQNARTEGEVKAAPAVDPNSPLHQQSVGPVDEAEGEGAYARIAAIALQERVSYAEAAPAVESFAVPPAPTFETGEGDALFGEGNTLFHETPESAPAMLVPSAVPRTGGFGEHLAEHLARSDMEMEVQRMRDEMERMRAEMEELRVARRVSPQYAEAMELSQRGLTAQDVADHLGISLAEAELVHALSRGEKNFDEGGDNGEDRYAASDGFDGFNEFGSRRADGR